MITVELKRDERCKRAAEGERVEESKEANRNVVHIKCWYEADMKAERVEVKKE